MFISVFVKNKGIKYNYLHWKELQKLMRNNFEDFKGINKDFIFVDLDDKVIIQNCFDFSNFDRKKFKDFQLKQV